MSPNEGDKTWCLEQSELVLSNHPSFPFDFSCIEFTMLTESPCAISPPSCQQIDMANLETRRSFKLIFLSWCRAKASEKRRHCGTENCQKKSLPTARKQNFFVISFLPPVTISTVRVRDIFFLQILRRLTTQSTTGLMRSSPSLGSLRCARVI